MAKKDLKTLTIEELRKKEKDYLVVIWIFVPLIIGLFIPVITDLIKGNEVDMSILTIAICTLGGPVTVYPELKAVRKEISNRNGSF
jgi:hypothetical protein